MTHARIGKKIPPGFSLDVDLPIGPGVTAIHGPAGAGKTLLLELLAGLARPDSGRILLEDAILFDAVSRVDVPARGRHCASIGQTDALVPHMTLRQNLLFAAGRRPRLERHRKAGEMLERFDLKAAGEKRPAELAAEERLRGELARALASEPKLLLADDRDWTEPLVRQMRAVAVCAIVLVTGDLDLCCAAADELVLLSAGQIAQRGAPRHVLEHPESLEAARLVGIPNLFPATIAALDPGQNRGRLELAHFALNGPYIRGHFRGDRVWVAIRPENVRVHSGEAEARPGLIAVELLRAVPRWRWMRLEFSLGISADVPHEEYARRKDNKSWLVEFPPEALRIL
jgi:molybdate transport system ATP-binding protein